MNILVLNAGSATLKFKLFATTNLQQLATGTVERIGLKKSFISCQFTGKPPKQINLEVKNYFCAVKLAADILAKQKLSPSIIGHRVVHGGTEFVRPTLINLKILKRLARYNQLAPLHNPANLDGIKAARKIWPQVKNYAVFDTAFFSTLPDYARTYALPYRLNSQLKIRKYGFHGLAHEWMMLQAQKQLKLKPHEINLVTCHLGSGCSLTAIKGGRAIDNSLGFTPMAGLVMSTRCGDLDPGIIFYLLKKLRVSPARLESILNFESGFYGLSGVSRDLRDILKVKNSNQRANLALKVFIYQIQKYLGAYNALIGGAKAIVFSGGIGERSAVIRKLILSNIKLTGQPKILVVPANEELLIAQKNKKLDLEIQ